MTGAEVFAMKRVERKVSVEILVRRAETLQPTMYLGELFFDLAAPSVRRSVQVPCFLGEKVPALKQHGARYVGLR